MGKREKKPRHRRHPRREASHYLEGGEDSFSYENLPSSSKPPLSDEEDEEEEVEEEEQEQEHDSRSPSLDIPSKFLLYQQSVQVCGSSTLSGFNFFLRKDLCIKLNSF